MCFRLYVGTAFGVFLGFIYELIDNIKKIMNKKSDKSDYDKSDLKETNKAK